MARTREERHNMNFINTTDNMEYNSLEPETTYDKCPNKCGQLLVKWTEQNGPDDYRDVWYCVSCEERIDE